MALTVGMLVFEGFNLLDLTGPLSVFETANNFLEAENHYVPDVCSVKAGAVTSSSGVEIMAGAVGDKSFDILIVPGGRGVDKASHNSDLLALFEKEIASLYVSVCTGAFILAAAGKFYQKKATTHWARVAELKQLLPDTLLQPDEIVVEDGNVWSSAGATAGMDIALALLESRHGKEITHLVTRVLLIPHRRTRGQLQFVNMNILTPPPPRILDVIDYINHHLQDDLSVPVLAERAFLSVRQLSREFIIHTGFSPARAVEHIRVEFARSKVENTNLTFSVIAMQSGFRDIAQMRKAFLRSFNASPRALRTRAHI